MPKILEDTMVQRITGLELNALLYSGALPIDVFHRARVIKAATPIYDISGEILFYRVPLLKGRERISYADIAANSAFSQPLLAVAYGAAWDEKKEVEKCLENLKKQRKEVKYNKVRFVSYSYPKLAVQFLMDGREVMMVELASWKPVPGEKSMVKDHHAYFKRWSLIEEVPPKKHNENARKFKARMGRWEEISPYKPEKREGKADIRSGFVPEVMDMEGFREIIRIKPSVQSRELHYSRNNEDHISCYELRGQSTNVWCVAASVQMILDFYRYNYEQTRIASELRLGTLTSPNGLPYSRDSDVVTVIEDLTDNALQANMNTSPNWNEFVVEIDENRPLVSFIPGHARTVAGYISVRLGYWFSFRGLLVYDPWPPEAGVIARWENFEANTYRRTFTAQLKLK